MTRKMTSPHPDSFVDSHAAASRLDAKPGWDVVIVYDDAPAGRRAVISLDAVVHKLGGKKRPRPRLWRFDLLEEPEWCATATTEAAQASLLIISATSKGALPTTVQDWVHRWLGQSRGTAAALAALLGPADDTDTPDSPRIQLLRRMVEAAGLSFFAPAPPLPRPPDSPMEAHPAQAPPAVLPSRRILLVEDDDALRELGARALMDAGYQVDAVGGGQPGWEALQAHPYDLLITDNQMPGLSGFELVRKLRSARMALPVIMASGGIGAEDLTRNQWLQPATVLPKPFTSDALLKTVAEVLPLAGRVHDRLEFFFPEPVDAYNHWGLNE
jgi:CheY-like chemotaxis protein